MRLFASTLLLLFACAVHNNEAQHARYKAQNEQQGIAATLFKGLSMYSLAISEVRANDEQSYPYDAGRDCLYRAYLLFTILGVIGAVIGIVFLVRQTKATEKAANAASDNARAVINAERAWILVRLDSIPGVGGVFEHEEVMRDIITHKTSCPVRIICTNEGRTPAWITEKRACIDVVDSLPSNPNWETVQIIQTEPEPLAGGRQTSKDEGLICDKARDFGSMVVIPPATQDHCA